MPGALKDERGRQLCAGLALAMGIDTPDGRLLSRMALTVPCSSLMARPDNNHRRGLKRRERPEVSNPGRSGGRHPLMMP